MSKVNMRIKIELLSDLCVGSGYSYAGIVDNDICYDEYGIPYIPARRIKGCMREVLSGILYTKYPEQADSLFGSGGESGLDDGERKVRIGNAYIADHSKIRKSVETLQNYDCEIFAAQYILYRFTHVVAQTAIKEEVAEDNTLRFTRVVNRYDPLGEKGTPLSFYADISYEENDKEVITDILKGVRHMGLKRNRGFGNVRCSLIPEEKTGESCTELYTSDEKDGKKRIYYAINNTEPLVLSSVDEQDSESYITGQSVLGLLAGRYIKQKGKPESDEFNDLFLNGKVIYSNLYPCDGTSIYYPAPGYICMLKKSKRLVYNLADKLPEIDEEMKEKGLDHNDGNLPKLLKGKYVSLDEKNVTVHEVMKDIIYHDRHEDEENNVEKILYSSTVIRPGQCFKGYIEAPVKYVDKIKNLLLEGDLYFGKSKSAQYGRCVLAKTNEDSCKWPEEKQFKAGEAVIVTFLSDAAIIGSNSEYSVGAEDIRKAFEDIFKKKYGVGFEYADDYISMIKTKLLTGYLRTWNLRKYPVPGIKAGSFIVIKANKDFETDSFYIGEKNHEGYGYIRFDRAEDYKYDSLSDIEDKNNPEDEDTEKNTSEDEDIKKNTPENEDVKKKTPEDEDIKSSAGNIADMIIPVIVDRWLEDLIYRNLDNSSIEGTTNSAVGRWKLMLMESCENADSDEAFKDFSRRINSIANESIKEKGKRLLELAINFRKAEPDGRLKEVIDKTGIDVDEVKRRLYDRWGEYIMAMITIRKYRGGKNK